MPVAFWLLAIGGIVVWEIFNHQRPITNDQSPVTNYLPALLALLSAYIIRRIPRHTSAVEPCFEVALLLGIAAYWLPSVVFLIIPIWGYLIYQNLFNSRAFVATLLGLATVAIWIVVGNVLSLFTFHFSIAHNVRLWFPTGAILVAWLASTTARQILHVR